MILMFPVSSLASLDPTITAGDQRARATIDIGWADYVSNEEDFKHVSINGGDDLLGDGSEASPWQTINHAIHSSRLAPGQTLVVHAGVYEEHLDLSGSADGTRNEPITIQGEPGAIVRQPDDADYAIEFTRDYWIVDGLEFDGQWYFRYLLYVPTGTHHVVVRNSILRDNGRDAFVIAGSEVYAHNNIIRDVMEGGGAPSVAPCTSHSSCGSGEICKYPPGGGADKYCYDHEDGHGFAIISNASNVLLTANSVHDVSGDGMQCSGPAQEYNLGTRPANITLEDNEMYTSSSNFGVCENAVDIKDCDRVTLRRETYHRFRPTTTASGNASGGAAIVFHYYGDGLLIEDSDISDACVGVGTGNRADDTVGNLILRRNKFHDFYRNRESCDDDGYAVRFEKLAHADVYHNTFHNADYADVAMGSTWEVSDVDVWNNIFSSSAASAAWIEVSSSSLVSGLESDYNQFHHSDNSSSHFRCGSSTLISHSSWQSAGCATLADPTSAVGDPDFVSASTGNFSLESTSPAVDTALNNAPPATVCGSGPDKGALERCASGGGTNPAVATLSDKFDDSSLNSSLWTLVSQTGGAVSETTSLNLSPNASTTASLVVESSGQYDLTGSSAYVRAPEVVSMAGNISEQFSLKLDSSNKIYWQIENGSLHARKKVAGTGTTIASVTYSSTDHQWLRIRESSGTVYWETSADATNWTQRATTSVSGLFAVDALTVTFFVETYNGGSATPGQARFSYLNTPPDGGTADVQDSFDDGSIDSARWSASQTNGTVTESGGTLNMTPAASNGSVSLSLNSIETKSLLDSMIFAEVPQVVGSGGSVGQRLEAKKDGSNKISWILEGTTLAASYKNAGTTTTVASVTYSSTAHRWWRIRESGGTIYWDTSSDGSSWTQQASLATSSIFAPTSVMVSFYVETWGSGSSSPGTAKFDNLNISP